MDKQSLSPSAPSPDTQPAGFPRLDWRVLIPLAGLLGTILWGLWIVRDRALFVRSSDAYVQGKIVLVGSSVGGRILSLNVNEGDPVNRGEILLTIDTTGDRYADRFNGTANLGPYRTLEGDLVRLVRIRHEVDDARDHYRRGGALLKNRFISLQDLEDLKTAFEKEQAQEAMLTRLVAADREQLARTEVHPRNRTVFAPVSGQIAQRLVNLGESVRPDQPLVSLVNLADPGSLWIDAYLRETQIGKVHPGQKVDIRVDAYPGNRFHGRVLEFIPAATQAFSPLPAQNAAGTFVKVIQRIPVRIDLDSLEGKSLYPGMSAEVKIVRTP